jgi:hypothetical protein
MRDGHGPSKIPRAGKNLVFQGKIKGIVIMGTNNIVFLEVLEWFDDTGEELVHRIP